MNSKLNHGKETRESLLQERGDASNINNHLHVFEIADKSKRWRKVTLILNASIRFKYNLLHRKHSKDGLQCDGNASRFRVKFKVCVHAILAVVLLKDALATAKARGPPAERFGINGRDLVSLLQEQSSHLLQRHGGIEGLAKHLRTDSRNGIKDDPGELERRKTEFGENTFPKKASKSFLFFLWQACQDKALIILIVCASLSLVTEMVTEGPKNGWYDGASISLAVFLVIFVTAISDHKQFLQFQNLNAKKNDIQVQVIRHGRRQTVSIFFLVVGDLVALNIGDQVPADGLFVGGHSLTIDESSMTGESDPSRKDSKNPYLMSGCKVEDGYGEMLVTGVGMNTEWGQVMASLSQDTAEETPLQVRLNGVAIFIGKIGFAVAIIVFTMLFIRYFAQDYHETDKALAVLKSIVDIFSVAVTIVVVAVPEGLPLAVTLTLAYSMKKMMADQCLVRNLPSCETMGSVKTICTDKTGTLTMNQMSVLKCCVAGELRDKDDISFVHATLKSAILNGIAHNSSGSVFKTKEGKYEISGSPTEKALLSWGIKNGMHFDLLRSKATVLQVEAFNSVKKIAGVAIELGKCDAYCHWKGAAEIILEHCDSWLDADGRECSLIEEKVRELNNIIAGMAAASLRCIALAYRKLDSSEISGKSEQEMADWKIPSSSLVLTTIVGITDRCRPGVRQAVTICQAAGIKVRMVTGDNLLTAKAIAQECAILTPEGIALEGRTFRGLSDEERLSCAGRLEVMARSSPTDKLLLVRTLKELGQEVAVTGDGTNDAPALREANIGLAMGIAGTEVAKESADVIILDDNFASIVKLVRWGRSVYLNIQKFVQFQLTVNIVALAINFIAACRSEDVPLNAVQLLWVNMIMDTLGALALATEPPTDELLKQLPVERHAPLITNIMWRNILAQAAYQLTVLLLFYFKGSEILRLKGDPAMVSALNNTIIFNSFVFCQLFNEINCRSLEHVNVFKGILGNRMFCAVVGVTSILQVVIVEFLKTFFKTTRLSWHYWLVCLLTGSLSLVVGFLVKFIHVPQLNRRRP